MKWHHGLPSVSWFTIWFSMALLFGVTADGSAIAEQMEKQMVHLYFADANRPFLIAEARVMVNPGDPMAFGRQLVVELINGSARGNLATIPTGTQLRSFFLLDDGTAVVDFSAQLRENHPGGCRLEQLTLFSVVNSLILNVSEIDRVKILIDGEETQTLTGHLPLEFPLTADMLLTR
ncbi:MAG: GerMN domain-containing protein [Desulfosarcina sp.]|nr:GerMN domain-containing protein [Desulfosarcina sp.]MBC2744035.1 GerMN domain-containing protein [Desulfosarcina sp.]MBC2766944.1 GerMN domain-containing protein [Desulfosarcina sp.]